LWSVSIAWHSNYVRTPRYIAWKQEESLIIITTLYRTFEHTTEPVITSQLTTVLYREEQHVQSDVKRLEV